MRKWTVILENEFRSDRPPVSIDITQKQVNIFLSVVSFFLISSFAILLFAKMNNLNPDDLIGIYVKRDILVNSIESKNRELNDNIELVDKYIDYEKKLRVFSNLAPLSEDVRQLGLGGYDFNDERMKELDSSTKRMIENVDKRLYQVQTLVDFEIKKVKEINNSLYKSYNVLKHTPSIFPTEGGVTSGFGMRIHPFSKAKDFHPGIDIANKSNTPIYASADGEVIYADYLSGYGKTLKIDHGYGYITVYAHLNKIDVNVGDVVKRHQLVANMGSTGLSTGTHLHYEVRLFEEKINPYNYFDFDTTIE